MIGPKPKGYWSGTSTKGTSARRPFLTPGTAYRVIQAFVDYDGYEHSLGETWTFLGSNFLPHEDGASWFVSLDGESEWHIRLEWRAEGQAHVLEHLSDFGARLPG